MPRGLTTRRSAALIALATALTTIGTAAVSTTATAAVNTTTATTTAGTTTTTVPSCAVTWGSGPKTTGTNGGGLTNVRAGRQECYDRLVLDGATWAQVRYVDQVRADGSGAVVPLRGGARLEIITSRADDPETGTLTYQPADPRELVSVAGWPTFRQVAFAGSFEGQTTVGLGVRALLPFQVFTLTGPPRVVIDVAHHW